MRFVATADWQLGMTAHFLDDDARPRYQRARLDAVRAIGELARDREAAFVVVGGDVFESNQLDRAIVSRAFEALRAFTVPVVLVPGNHDPLDSASIYDSAAFTDRVPEHVTVARDAAPIEVVPGAEVVAASWSSKRPLHDLVAQACAWLEPVPQGTVRVVVGHGAVSSLNPDRDAVAAIDVPALREVLASGCAHVAVLGDRHATTEVAANIWYPGTPEVTSRREDDPGNVLVVDVDPAIGAVEVEKVHVGTWTFTTLAERVDSEQDVRSLEQRLEGIPDKDRTAVWLQLTGTLTMAAKARLDEVLQEAGHRFARIDHWRRHTDLAVIPDDHDFEDLALGGFTASAVAELIELLEDDGEHAGTVQDALGLLYRFAGGAR